MPAGIGPAPAVEKYATEPALSHPSQSNSAPSCGWLCIQPVTVIELLRCPSILLLERWRPRRELRRVEPTPAFLAHLNDLTRPGTHRLGEHDALGVSAQLLESVDFGAAPCRPGIGAPRDHLSGLAA